MSAPVDHKIRARALDPMGSFIVQAPAGSGKTELLTRRVLTLLCTVDEPEEILAITFTRKAASEMRQRVLNTLVYAAQNPQLDDPHEQEGVQLAQKVLERDKQLGWQLRRNPQRLNLRTIDALATRLAHQLPVTSTLGAPVGMIENAHALYHEAAGRFIESNLESIDLLLLLLGNKLEKAQSLFASLLAKRDQWKRHVYAASGDHEHLRAMLEGMLAELIESRLQNLCALLPTGVRRHLPQYLPKAAEFALLAVEGDISELPWEMQLWHTIEAMPGADISDLDLWASIAHSLLTTEGSVRKRLTKKEGFPSKADAKKLGVDASALVEHKQAMVDLLEELIDEPDFCAALKEVRKLPAPTYKDEQWALLSQLLTVLPHLLLELQLVFAEHSMVDFSEISVRAALALGSDDEPTDLALSMDLSLKHVLVDEFQDTSQTQFKLFEKLLKSWQSGDGRTFFAVGDPMQSIYRFREGDVALFTRVQEQGIADVDVEPLTLSVNFRSSPAITEWVNDSFGKVFPKEIDVDSGAIPYSPSDAFRNYAGHVQIHALIDVDKVREAEEVAGICQSAIANDTKHSVAILVRSRAQAAEIFVALRKHNLAYASIDMDAMGERPVVRDLIALVMALRYPHDRLHWLALLRSPFVGLSLHDLHSVLDEASARAAVVECLTDELRIERLSDDGQHRVRRLMAVVSPALARGRRGRLMPWVESVWLKLGGPVVCEGELDRDAADRALGLLYKLEQQGMLWHKSVIDAAMAGLYAKSTDTEHCQIQVMTLHKSKGLEFDTVILPALDRRARGNSTQLLNWFEGSFKGEPQLLLAPFEQSGLNSYAKDKLIKLVKSADERCDDQEKLRLLYVACTRAKKHLHLVAQASSNSENELTTPVRISLLSPLWPLLQPEFEAARVAMKPHIETQPDAKTAVDWTANLLANSAPEQAQLSLDMPEPAANDEAIEADTSSENVVGPTMCRLPLGVVMPTFEVFVLPNQTAVEQKSAEETVEFLWAGSDARHIGTVVHEQLQMLSDQRVTARVSASEPEGVVERQLKNLGVSDNRLKAAVEKVKTALDNTLNDERGRWILSHHDQARNEWALTVPAELGNASEGRARRFKRVIIDRTFVDEDGVRWIIDYKTGDHEGGNVESFLDTEQKRYASQLNGYADIMSRLDNRPVKVGLYFPMLKAWRQWQPATQA